VQVVEGVAHVTGGGLEVAGPPICSTQTCSAGHWHAGGTHLQTLGSQWYPMMHVPVWMQAGHEVMTHAHVPSACALHMGPATVPSGQIVLGTPGTGPGHVSHVLGIGLHWQVGQPY
jgi:hypothetical protein